MTEYQNGKDVALLEVRVQSLENAVRELVKIIKDDDETEK